jgi:hypothetical protein
MFADVLTKTGQKTSHKLKKNGEEGQSVSQSQLHVVLSCYALCDISRL